MTAALVAFYRARLDADEAVARDATAGPWTTRNLGRHDGSAIVTDTGERTPLGLPVGQTLGSMHGPRGAADGSHIARHDPARVLAEVAAKRETIRMWEEAVDFVEIAKSHGREATHYEVAAESYLNVIRRDAAVHREHPEYDPSWAPEGVER
ncbi:MAG TPA: DUF6221 family protein [Actinoplanes sp.]|nr:DUF6221 family protein [Actinoplanes sp.]